LVFRLILWELLGNRPGVLPREAGNRFQVAGYRAPVAGDRGQAWRRLRGRGGGRTGVRRAGLELEERFLGQRCWLPCWRRIGDGVCGGDVR
jgi:hypothetical protein